MKKSFAQLGKAHKQTKSHAPIQIKTPKFGNDVPTKIAKVRKGGD
jgi:hypothetical protein